VKKLIKPMSRKATRAQTAPMTSARAEIQRSRALAVKSPF
jgi:hypothetical protein